MATAPPACLHWGNGDAPIPVQWVLADGQTLPESAGDSPLDFTFHMRRLCEDIVRRCESLSHIDMSRVLVSFTPSRSRSRYGLQARLTPLRFRAGRVRRPYRTGEHQVQRFFVNDVEMLYVLTFCLPRFFNHPLEEKLATVVHELFHIGPAFDGDLRRLAGRCEVHSSRKSRYESHVTEMAKRYLATRERSGVLDFLRFDYRELWQRHGGIRGVVVPRPKVFPSCATASV
jgi:predicted metallopeptidase